jgi:rubrerythrin
LQLLLFLFFVFCFFLFKRLSINVNNHRVLFWGGSFASFCAFIYTTYRAKKRLDALIEEHAVHVNRDRVATREESFDEVSQNDIQDNPLGMDEEELSAAAAVEMGLYEEADADISDSLLAARIAREEEDRLNSEWLASYLPKQEDYGEAPVEMPEQFIGWCCLECTYLNSGALDTCEMCGHLTVPANRRGAKPMDKLRASRSIVL